MTLKVMIYTDDPGLGGNAVYAHHLALDLVAAGMEVVYVQGPLDPDNPQVQERSRGGVRHIALPYSTIDAFFHGILDRRAAEEILFCERPDVVIFSDSVPQSTAMAKEAAAGLGIPSIAIKHLVLPENAWAAAPATRGIVNRSLAATDVIVTVSKDNAATLSRLFTVDPARLVTVYNAAPDRCFIPPSPAIRQRLRAEWDVDETALVIFSAARFVAQKGYDLQVRVMERLAELGALDRMVFVWAGHGEPACWNEIMTMIETAGLQDRVRVLGQRSDIDHCLDAADILFLPSRGEGMPLSVIEAMAKGVPVLASAASGIPEAMGDTGALLPDPAVDADGLVAQAVETLLRWAADPGLRAAIGRQAADRASRLFRPERRNAEMRSLICRAAFPGDYVAPGLEVIRPDRDFPCIQTFDGAPLRHPPERTGGRHRHYLNTRRPGAGVPNRDESLLIHNTALRCRGQRILVLGGGFGWTVAHVKTAAGVLDVLEPLLDDPTTRDGVTGALAKGVNRRAHMGKGSPESVAVLAAREDDMPWGLAVMDFDLLRDLTLPYLNAALPYMADDAFILMTGAARPEVTALFTCLTAAGWRLQVYDTARALAVAWRGAVQPVPHTPDPDVAWDRPAHLDGLFASP